MALGAGALACQDERSYQVLAMLLFMFCSLFWVAFCKRDALNKVLDAAPAKLVANGGARGQLDAAAPSKGIAVTSSYQQVFGDVQP